MSNGVPLDAENQSADTENEQQPVVKYHTVQSQQKFHEENFWLEYCHYSKRKEKLFFFRMHFILSHEPRGWSPAEAAECG